MLSKKAIIIANNTGYHAPTYLGGVTEDIKNYCRYLLSDIGGSWDENEIEILHNKTKAEIKSEINGTFVDYSFIIYSGHGFVDRETNLTYMCVKDGFLSETELNTNSNRQTNILDCCRTKESLTESISGFSEHFEKGGPVRLAKRRIIYNAKNRFNNALLKSDYGIFRGYACLIGQTSSDNPNNGGLFLNELLKVANNFGKVDNPLYGWMSIKSVVIKATNSIKKNRLTTQVPTYKHTAGMTLTAPFALTNWVP